MFVSPQILNKRSISESISGVRAGGDTGADGELVIKILTGKEQCLSK